MLPSRSGILVEAINKTIFSSIFTQNSLKNFSNLLFTCTKAFSTIDLLCNRIVLYNRIILYNRTIRSLVIFIFIGVTFGVFGIIYFRLPLKALRSVFAVSVL